MKKIKNNNKLISTNIVETVFLVPTAVGSYDDTRARTRHKDADEPIRRSTIRGCQKGKSLERGSCTVAASPLVAAVVLQSQQQSETRSETDDLKCGVWIGLVGVD